MKTLRNLINESGAGLWGTDKARAKLQKDTPGQEIKALVKSKEVSEAADPKGTIKVVKQDKVRYITKDELNSYKQMGWKQAEKRPQGNEKIRAAKKAHAAGTWDGNVTKDGKPIVHIDGTPVVVEETKRITVSFKFYSVADSAKAERQAKQMKKLTTDSEKIQGKNLWLLHVTGDYADVIKYLRRNDLQTNIRQTTKADEVNENYARDLDLAHKNMVRLTNKETGQDKKDYMAVTRALNQGNLGAVKKVIKSIKSVEIQADILNVLVGYNNLIAKMYPKATDARGRLKTPMNVSKMIKDDVNEETIEEGSETWEAGYKRRVVKTTKPEHKEKGYNWRIKGKDKAHLTIKLYKDKPSQAEFNKQMKRVAGHEFGG